MNKVKFTIQQTGWYRIDDKDSYLEKGTVIDLDLISNSLNQTYEEWSKEQDELQRDIITDNLKPETKR